METEIKSLDQSSVPIKFFSVSTWKFVLLSVTTAGLYDLFWFYKNWKAIKEAEKSKIGLFWRTWWVIFFIDDLFRKIITAARQNGFNEKLNGPLLALFYIILAIAGNVSARGDGLFFNILWVASFFSVIPLIQIQKAINFNNKKLDPTYVPSEKFSTWETAIAIVGGIILLLAIIGLFVTLPTDSDQHAPFPSTVT